jgi:hypothetical protein
MVLTRRQLGRRVSPSRGGLRPQVIARTPDARRHLIRLSGYGASKNDWGGTCSLIVARAALQGHSARPIVGGALALIYRPPTPAALGLGDGLYQEIWMV